MKASGNMSHRFIPMHVAPDSRFKSTTKLTTPSTFWKRVYPTRARVISTTSRSTTVISKKRILYTPSARFSTTTTRSRQFVPYPYWKDGSVSQNKLSEISSNQTRFIKPVVPKETRKIDSTYVTKDRTMHELNLDRIIGPDPYREPLLNVSNMSLIKDSDHIIPYHVPVVIRSTETQLIDTTVVTEITTEISTELSIDVSTKMEDTTNYGLVFASSALLFLVGTILLYVIIGKLVQNISRLKKQRQTYQRVNTDVDMTVRLDNIEGQMINCKRLIEKNLKKNKPTVASVENMVSFVHRRV